MLRDYVTLVSQLIQLDHHLNIINHNIQHTNQQTVHRSTRYLNSHSHSHDRDYFENRYNNQLSINNNQ